jgi:xylulokinase
VRATDLSDAAGTWLLDQAERRWSAAAAAVVGIDPAILPPLVEGIEPTGTLRPQIAARFGLDPRVQVAGGAGDAAAGGVGIGAVEEGASFVSLGTSAQFFVARDHFAPAPERFVHAFCHAVPARWYQMAAMLTGASILGAVIRLTGESDVGALLREAEAAFAGPSSLVMLPYLTGERTPHDDPLARGVVLGIGSATDRAELTLAALEGVAFMLADALEALGRPPAPAAGLGLIGGGARSAFWARLIASILERPVRRFRGGETGPAFGAARLARLAVTGEPTDTVIVPPPTQDVIAPDPALTAAYQPRLALFRALYQAVRPVFWMDAG